LDDVNCRGYSFLQSHLPEQSTLEVVTAIGTPLRLKGLADIQSLKPRQRCQASPNMYSGNYGLDDFPLHTDLAHWYIPPRYLVLRCLTGAGGVATRLLDGNDVIKAVGEGALRRALVQPRRPLANNRPLLRLLDQTAAPARRLRWDRLFVSPATSASAATFSAMNSYLEQTRGTEVTLLHPGDILIVDNWRVLHGRSAVSAASENRWIERAYLGDLQ
jgi:L-asparagine oxygenase